MTIDHLNPLSRNVIFWLLTAGPATVGLLLGIIIWSGMNFSLTPSGYNYFLTSSTMPLGVMSLAFPLGGIYGLLHKSKQLSQQMLDGKLQRLHESTLDYINSIDAIIVLLFRFNNQTALLNGWLCEEMRDQEKIEYMLTRITQSWSSFYSEPRFYPAMSQIVGRFNNIDAIVSGYEVAVRKLLLNSKLSASKIKLAEFSEELSALENFLLDHRKVKDVEYSKAAHKIIASYNL